MHKVSPLLTECEALGIGSVARWLVLKSFFHVIDAACKERRLADASRLARFALNIAFDPDHYQFSTSELLALNKVDFTRAMELLEIQRDANGQLRWVTDSPSAEYEVARLKNIVLIGSTTS